MLDEDLDVPHVAHAADDKLCLQQIGVVSLIEWQFRSPEAAQSPVMDVMVAEGSNSVDTPRQITAATVQASPRYFRAFRKSREPSQASARSESYQSSCQVAGIKAT